MDFKDKITPDILRELHQMMSSDTAELVRKHLNHMANAMGVQLTDEMTDGQVMLLQEKMNHTLLDMCEECFKKK